MRLIRIAAVVLLALLPPALLWSQVAAPEEKESQASEQPTQESDGIATSPSPSDAGAELQAVERLSLPLPVPLPVTTPAEIRNQHSDHKQTERMFWVVPNFAAVNPDTQLPPLSARGKFVLAMRDSMDYSGFTWTAVLAGQAMATRSVPELGTGVKGYARYYWRTFADGVSGTFFTEAIVPAITREDPRYYTMGHGGFFRRFGYALSRTVITKTDSGGSSFNWSELVGNALEAGLSNAYYPPQERGGKQAARDWGTQMESAVLNNIAKEFWPDIRHLILRHD